MKIKDVVIKGQFQFLVSISDKTGKPIKQVYLDSNHEVDGNPVNSVSRAIEYYEKYLKKSGQKVNVSDINM